MPNTMKNLLSEYASYVLIAGFVIFMVPAVIQYGTVVTVAGKVDGVVQTAKTNPIKAFGVLIEHAESAQSADYIGSSSECGFFRMYVDTPRLWWLGMGSRACVIDYVSEDTRKSLISLHNTATEFANRMKEISEGLKRRTEEFNRKYN